MQGKRNTAPIQDARGWNAHSHHIKPMIGIPAKAKLPADGQAAKEVQGVQVFVISLKEAKERNLFHRVRAICPKCGVEVSAGRLMQHVCG